MIRLAKGLKNLKATNSDFEAIVRDSFSRQPFMALVGAKMTELSAGFCELSVMKHADLMQQHEFFHGGLVVSIADSAAGYAAYSLFPKESTVLTVELKTNFLNPANGDGLAARATVISQSETLYHVKADVYSVTDESEVHCLTGIFTMMCLVGKTDNAHLKKSEFRNAKN